MVQPSTFTKVLSLTLLFVLACSGDSDLDPVAVHHEPLPPVPEDDVAATIDVLPPAPPIAKGSPVGFLTGTFTVSDQGDAEYELPLAIPPGREGMTPEVALDYSSARGQGLLGLGWTVAVDASRIERCGRTVAQDGYARAVRFDDEDRLCLDGQRLVVVNQRDYWDAGAEYRTELDRIAKIVRLPAGSAGPTFEVWTRDGRIRRYGATSGCNGCGTVVWGDGHREQAWLVAEEHDRHGNLIRYGWDHSLNARPGETAGGSETEAYRPGTIWYTANPSQGLDATRRIDFFYRSRFDRRYGWKLGARRTSDWLLERIEVRADEQLWSTTPPRLTYEMEYESPAPARRLRLASVRVCDHAGVCQEPTTFRYQTGTAGFEPPIAVAGAAPSIAPWTYDPDVPYVMDVNNDGRDDLMYPNAGRWRVRLANPNFGAGSGSGAAPFLPEIDTSHATVGDVPRGLPLDFDADGDDDLLLFENGIPLGAHGIATWRILLSNGDGTFALHDTGSSYPRRSWWGQASVPLYEPEDSLWPSAQTLAADLDGDGLPDLVTYDLPASGTANYWNIRLNDGRGHFGPPVRLADIGVSEYAVLTPFAIDLDGDGVQELMAPDPCNCAYGSVWFENGAPVYRQTPSLEAPQGAGDAMQPLSVNGDGMLDVVYRIGGWQSPRLPLFVNTGAGFMGNGSSLLVDGFEGTADFSSNWYLPLAAAIDYDRDGVGDLMMPRHDPGSSTATSAWGVLVAKKGADYLQAGGADVDNNGQPDPYLATVDPAISFDAIGACEGYTRDSTPSSLTHAYGRPRIMDVDGDGLGDLVQVECGQFVVRRGAGVPDGLLEEVWEGRKPSGQPGAVASYSVTYASGADAKVYQRGVACAYPEQCAVPRKPLVGELVVDTGLTSPPMTYRYEYEDWRADVLGLGGLGFVAMTVTESSAGQVARTEFATFAQRAGGAYPLLGRVSSTVRTTTLDNATIVDARALEYHVKPTWPGVQVVTTAREAVSRVEHRAGQTTVLRDEVTEHAPPTWHGGAGWSERTTPVETERTDRELADRPSTWVVAQVVWQRTEADDGAGHVAIREQRRHVDMNTGVLQAIVDNPDRPADRRTTTFVRNAIGLIERVEVSDNAGTVRSLDIRHDAQRIFTTYTRNAEGHEMHRRVDPAWGVPLVFSNENGLITRQQVDAFGEVVAVEYPSGQKVHISRAFAPPGSDYVWSRRTQSPGHGDETELFGRRQQLVARSQVGLLGKTARIDYRYDSHGRVVETSEPHAPGSAPAAATGRRYDELGRLLGIDLPNGAKHELAYEGLSVITTDPDGYETRRTFDEAGNLVSVEDPGNARTLYDYGPYGALTRVEDPHGNVTAVELDALGRRSKLVDPDLGERRWEYDGFGDLSRTWSAEHGYRTYSLDRLGRVEQISDADGTTTFSFDIFGFEGALGRHESPTGVTVDTTHHAATGLPKSWVLRLPGENPLVLTAEYDGYGRPELLHYPASHGDTFSVRHEYDTVGNVVAVDDADTGKELWRVRAGDVRGNPTLERFGNGVQTTRKYLPASGRLSRISSRRSGARHDDVQDLTYGYDAAGRVRFRFDQLQDVGAGLAETFGYDRLGRVESVRMCGAAPTLLEIVPAGFDAGCRETLAIDYDELGNITQRSDLGTYRYDAAQPHAVTRVDGRQYWYDANGNQRGRGDWSVDYTAFDLPRSFTHASTGEIVSLEYDGEQRRVRKIAPGRDSVYLREFYRRDDVPGAAWGHPDATHRYFVFAGKRVVAEVVRDKKGQQILYYHRDHLGSADVQSDDASGQAVKLVRASYDVFGKPRDSDWTSNGGAGMTPDASVGYTGHELDDQLGLVNMIGRVYDPTIGRFTTPDPMVQAAHSAQSFNRYSYVLNSPLSLVDPTGYQAEDPDYDDSYDDLDREDIEFGDGEGSYIEVDRPDAADGPIAPSEEADAGGVGADDNRDPPEPDDPGIGDRADPADGPGWGTRFAVTYSKNFFTTNKFFFQGPTRFVRSGLGLLTSGAVAESFGTVTAGQAARGLLFPGARTWGQVARGLVGLQPQGYVRAGASGVSILRGAGIPARGVGYFGAGQTVGSAALNSAVNVVLVTVALEAGITVGSAIDAGLQASGVDLSVEAPAAWAGWSDFVTSWQD